ncbi:hypothetical protein RHSIM_Rhsim06G0020800 [Rhododendron simsii]|uniref:J domain-containing protein n=1 Tax=Rhododendron simsii TaxID=118357 RepID=A0A834GWD7_RHOSS|nr:hypothetical protein RHSIM_Rhsim06G0020800 [Rhododendron simsii]
MTSASATLSTPFLSAKSLLNATPPTSVSFRQPLRVSAAYAATAERAPRIAAATSLYDVLGIHSGATCHEIKTAYRRLARTSHPDVKSNGGKDSSADEFIRIHAAYSTLSDPEKRADYDRNLLVRPSYAMSAGFSGRTRRTWETDQYEITDHKSLKGLEWVSGCSNKGQHLMELRKTYLLDYAVLNQNRVE